VIIAGPVFSLTLKKYDARPAASFAGKSRTAEELPGLFDSIFSALLPVILIGADSVVRLAGMKENVVTRAIHVLGDPVMALLFTIAFALWALVLKRGSTLASCMDSLGSAIKEVSVILLIIAGAGALKQVLADSGAGEHITTATRSLNIPPLFAAWGISAFIRVCLGSATVAGITTAGIVAPMVAGSGVHPSLMVLATGSGSLMFSHVNDTGFWMFKEYFNLSIRDTLKTWSAMETIVSLVGLVMVLLLNLFVH